MQSSFIKVQCQVGNKFETFSCRSIGDTRSCQVTAANRKKCQACRFAKCRQMGMTHTNLDTKTPSSTSTVSHHKPSSGHHLSVKHPSVTLSPIMEEPTDYSSDCYDYESQGYMDKNGKHALPLLRGPLSWSFLVQITATLLRSLSILTTGSQCSPTECCLWMATPRITPT